MEKARNAAGASPPTTGPSTQTSEPQIHTEWFSPDGKPVASFNTPDAGGLVRKFNAPVLGVTRSSLPEAKGTVLLFPGGAYSILDVLN